MATKPSTTILKGCQVLTLLAGAPEEARTLKGIVARSKGELSTDQVESALLAYLEAGWVSRRQGESGQLYYLLGAEHLRLALVEVDGLLAGLEQLTRLFKSTSDLSIIRTLLVHMKGMS